MNEREDPEDNVIVKDFTKPIPAPEGDASKGTVKDLEDGDDNAPGAA